jgi:5-methyltetrahydrofolate--homocysteine methyltransferase
VSARFLDSLRRRVLVLDGAMGTSIHAAGLDLERDFGGLENCCEVLNLRRPDAIRDIHADFLRVGCDAVETNTFGAMPHVLREFDLQDRCAEINASAVRAAREACLEFSTPDRPRFVIGSMGPGTKLATLGQITYRELEASYGEQSLALARAGIDAFGIETVQDPLQAKAAINAALAARREVGREIPILVSVTMEVTGTMLVGTEMAAALAILAPYPVDVLAINCATGPREMSEHVRVLGQSWPRTVGCYPNAGLPQLVDGQTSYPLTPQELADWMLRFVEEDGLGLVGGCCGTTPEHLAAVVRTLGERPPLPRKPALPPQVTSLYHAVDLQQENSILILGERSNANGSKKFREHLLAGNLDAQVEMGREQVREGSHALDLCVAYVGRDEMADMERAVQRYRTDVTAPLAIDSTEPEVLEGALELLGGRSIINSINLEEGLARAGRILPLARKHGSVVIALTIDEDGMARSVEDKVRIARRLYDLAVGEHGLRPEDLLFDVLTFTVCTGNEEDRKHAANTLAGVRAVREALPGVGTLLGLSNVSFGLKPAARHALNSVFLHHAQEVGLTAAILHAGRIEPLHALDPEVRQTCEDLIFDRRREGYDPLVRLMELFEGKSVAAKAERRMPEDVFERLAWRIVEGAKVGLEEDLDLARATKAPLDIVNQDLLAGMGTVGELFGKGEMQLPFVLQSAETMKAAVAHLEPHMERVEGSARGKIVLATVRGDVHDIGKNLVDIILTNNGYRVFNLGIKQPIERILEVTREHAPDAIGMSGLLVKSTVVMRENLEEMNRRGVRVPVILGGAALTRSYVEDDCRKAYEGPLYYARDAFEGLAVMERVVAGEARPEPRTRSGGRTAAQRALDAVAALTVEERPAPGAQASVDRADLRRDFAYPEAPFLGARVLEGISMQTVLPWINESTLFQFQWGYRRKSRSAKAHEAHIDEVVRPLFHELARRCEKERILEPRAVYGFWRCVPEGDALVLLHPEDEGREVARFAFPRQQGKKNLCIADFFRDDGQPDVLALQVVTVGQQASEVAREWFAADRYQDYLHLHGLSVEAAEGLAEYVHKEVRAQLGIASDDARDMRALFKQGYRGSRFSFGYPACPNLADQEQLLELLGAERIGVRLSEEFQLWPEQSTSALVCHHPEAKYFTI